LAELGCACGGPEGAILTKPLRHVRAAIGQDPGSWRAHVSSQGVGFGE
jgi:hypothetical protein